jgi:large subunit ribosomal protein L24
MGMIPNRSGVAKPHVVTGDTVVLRRGKEKGKRGVVKSVHPKDGMAVVEGLNVVKRHTKAGTAGAPQGGGIIEKEKPIPLSALMVIDPKTDKATRVRRSRQADGTVVRVSVKSGEQLLVPAKAR